MNEVGSRREVNRTGGVPIANFRPQINKTSDKNIAVIMKVLAISNSFLGELFSVHLKALVMTNEDNHVLF